jgi:hypothetical protein
MTVTLTLTDDEARALRDLAETYLANDGPAFECMPDWPQPHAPETLTALRTLILKEVAA